MEKHNFMVIFMYAIILSVILLVCGQPWFALIAFIVYTSFASIKFLKESSYKSKWNKMLSSSISEELREIILCHITQRSEKINKRVIKDFIENINSGSYTVTKETLTKIHAESPTSDEGYTYYLEFDDNGKLHYMSESRIHYFKVGDVMWHVSTANHSTDVVKGSKGYNNLLSPFVTKNKTNSFIN